MNQAEYVSRRQEICSARERALKELDERYAESNNPYKIGDYITDHIGTGKILNMAVARPFGKNTPPLYVVHRHVCRQEGEAEPDTAGPHGMADKHRQGRR